MITINLNRIIDVNFYPVPEAEISNKRHRPIGIGIQGLADLFIVLRLPWESKEAFSLNREIFETIYFASLQASCDLAKKEGPYSSYEGSPISKGYFQFDLWIEEAKEKYEKKKKEIISKGKNFTEIFVSPVILSERYDWEKLRKDILKHGIRNSLLISPPPTASTAQILGNNESIFSNRKTKKKF